MRQIHDYEDRSSGHSPRVELMVHGVGGTPPESMLDSHEIARVRGDSTAAFFRLKHERPDAEYVQEAYSWGGLTAGSATRAFWVFLAPFAFLNVAGWMLPPAVSDDGDGSPDRHHGFTVGVLRLIGLTVTVHAVIWIGQMSIDFAAWQCGGSVTCRSSTWVVSMFGWGVFEGAPGRRLVAGALIPLFVILVVYLLTRRTIDRYETVDDASLGDYEAIVEDSFADPTFWRRGDSLSGFASLHLGSAMAALAWVLAWTLTWLQPVGTPWIQWMLGTGALGLLVVGAFGVAVVRDPSPATDLSGSDRLGRLVVWHRSIVAVVLGLTMLSGVVWPGYEDPARNVALDPYASVWRLIWIASIVALVLFSVAVATHPRRSMSIRGPLGPDDAEVSVGFGSFGSVVAMLFGFLVAVAILGGFGAATARLLGGRPTISPTYLYDAFGIVTVVWLVTLFLALGVAWIVRGPVRISTDPNDVSDLEEELTAGFEEDRASFFAGAQRKRGWLISVRNERDARVYVRTVESILGWMVAVAMIGAIVLLAVQATAPDVLRSAIDSLPSTIVTGTTWFVAVGIPVGMIWAIRRAYGSQQTRKLIGTLWDVVTFWPRWFHPLAPPSYSGRAIPELRTRIDSLVRGGDHGGGDAAVVVTAHSQGSVVALAAIDGLRGHGWLSNVSLLTHGSPITRLYVRLFPAHMTGPIERVNDALDRERWVNLYRLTDPIGGAISGETAAGRRGSWDARSGHPLNDIPPDAFAAGQNPVADPDLRIFSDGSAAGPIFPKKGDPYPLPLGHSAYNRAPEFDRSVRSMLGLGPTGD